MLPWLKAGGGGAFGTFGGTSRGASPRGGEEAPLVLLAEKPTRRILRPNTSDKKKDTTDLEFVEGDEEAGAGSAAVRTRRVGIVAYDATANVLKVTLLAPAPSSQSATGAGEDVVEV